ncbi:MAG: MbnP family protein, partial [Bacteroidota bacterium]
ANACPENPPQLRATGAIVELPVQPFLENAPFVYGENNLVKSGATLVPTNLRFYVSKVALVRTDSTLVPVDLVTPQGAVAPYGVHLFNAEDAASGTLRVRAPAGSYAGINFLWGLTLGCNAGLPSERRPPLTDTSQMTWPHLGPIAFGYLFFRYDSLLTPGGQGAPAMGTPGDDAGAPVFAMIHMGGDPSTESAPEIQLRGSFSVPASGVVTKPIHFIMDEVFRGAAMDIDVTDTAFPGGGGIFEGERVRRSARGLGVFIFAP